MATLVTAAPAHAERSPQAQAAELFKQSVDAYRQGNLQRAAQLLNDAYILDPQPVLLYNLARAQEGLGQNDAAMDTYRRYLEADPKAPDRKAIEQRVTTLQRQHDEKAALEKQRDDERRRAEEASRSSKISEGDQERDRRAARDSEPPHKRSVGPYILAGVGVAGLGAGAVFGLMATSKHDDAVKEPVQTQAIDKQDQAKTFATVSTVGFIAGGVLLAAGVTWWVIDTPKKKESGIATRTRVGVGPSFVTVEGSF